MNLPQALTQAESICKIFIKNTRNYSIRFGKLYCVIFTSGEAIEIMDFIPIMARGLNANFQDKYVLLIQKKVT